MAARRRRPDPQNVLLESWREIVRDLGTPEKLVIGGKSMGGRIATLVADELGVAGLLCYGYPFHPPGKPERLRTEHLQTLRTKALIVQGSRDAFGSRAEVESYGLSPKIRVAWIEDGDHSLKTRVAAADALQQAIDVGVRFITSL